MRLPLPQFFLDSRHPDYIGEVMETATTNFLAQCLDPEELNFPTKTTAEYKIWYDAIASLVNLRLKNPQDPLLANDWRVKFA
jgi:hypothetical protein